MTTDVWVILGCAAGLLGAMVALVSLVTSRRGYRDLAITQQATLNLKMDMAIAAQDKTNDSITRLSCDMALVLKEQNAKIAEIDHRVTIAEESTKSAHKRIDEIRKGE